MARSKKPTLKPDKPLEKPAGPLMINVGRTSQCAAYELPPPFSVWIREAFPEVPRIPSVVLYYRSQQEFESAHGPYWETVARMLTGFSCEQLRDWGSVRLKNYATGEEWDVPLAPLTMKQAARNGCETVESSC